MLFKKMMRDIRFNKSQFITIFLMVFIGIMAYSGIESYMTGMTQIADKFYEEQNLQDLTAIGENFTEDDLDVVKNIDHVENVERRLTFIANVDGHEDKSLQMNFIESNEISKFYVSDGIPFDKASKGLWIDNYYSKENDLKVGDKISLKYDGYTFKDVEIVGIIYTPDHVYDIKDEASIFPDHSTYGYVYMSIDAFPEKYVKDNAMKKANITDEALFDMFVPDFNYKDYIIYNYLLIDVDDYSNADLVKNAIDEKVDSALAITKKVDTLSYATYQGEIEEGETYVGVFSGLFIFIALLSVVTTMTRVVQKQRIQIGTLKALGFKNYRVTMHYVGYGFWISLFGAIAGLIVGPLFIGSVFINLELMYYQIPNSGAVFPYSAIITAALVVLAVSLVTYITCRRELKDNPAETLRTQMPKVNRRSLNITTKGFFKKLSFASKWNFRDIIRNKMRTFMGIAGIIGCCILLVCGFGMFDSMNHFIDVQFGKIYDFKYKLSVKTDCTEEERNAIIEKYGDNSTQTLGIEIVNGDNKEANTILVNESNGFVKTIDGNEAELTLSDDGIFVTRKLAETKGYKVGDKIKWHIYGQDKYYESEIIGLDYNAQDQNVKTTKKYLESLGIEYKADAYYTNEDLSGIDKVDGVELIQDKDALREGLSNMLETMETMIILLVVIAAILGFVIIYNLGVLSFTEKQYQFATLKVLGFKDKQIKKIYVMQNNWITYVSIIVGLPLGYFMTDYIFKMALSDSYDFGAYIKPLSYAIGIFGTLVVSYLTSKVLSKKVKEIDMVTSLKGNE